MKQLRVHTLNNVYTVREDHANQRILEATTNPDVNIHAAIGNPVTYLVTGFGMEIYAGAGKFIRTSKVQRIEEWMNTETKSSHKAFVIALTALAAEIYANSFDHGFWEGGATRNKAEMIALMHSELSEALEGLRHSNPPDAHVPEFTSVEVELADTIIRVLDFAHGFGYRVGEAVIAKMEFNKSRPFKHGKTI